jgi:hypothetical protein
MSIRKQTIKEAILKRLGFFSLDQIVEEVHLPRKIVQEILDTFGKEGLIHETERIGTIGRPGIYRINRIDEGDDLSANKMWKVIRYKREFGLRDLIILANAKRETARAFLKSLRRAGYIEPNKPTGRGVFWTLVKDPGPRRPYIGDQVNSTRRRGDAEKGE